MAAPTADYSELVRTLVTPLLSEPEKLEVSESRTDEVISLTFSVHPKDTGRVIGRGGSSITAIRQVVEFAGQNNQEQVTLDLLED